MSPPTVPLRAISAATFAPYGRLLDTPGAMARRDFAAAVASLRPAARPNLALVRAPLAPAHLEVREMERHPFSTQAFFPLDVAEYLIVVAPADRHGAPLPQRAEAFRVPGTQGISYDAGTWHCGMTTLRGAGLFALLVFEDGSPDDTHFRPVVPFRITCGEPALDG